MEPTKSTALIIDPEAQMLVNNQMDGDSYKQRRSAKWRKNYEMYRNEAPINRLVQRQTVHIPFMKQQINTLMSNIDEMPEVNFESLDNDEEQETGLNEYWKETIRINNMELKDAVDKKQNIFFGRTFDQMQIINGFVKWLIIDPEDIVVSRFIDPTDSDSTRFLIHNHIYVPLAELENNPDYDKEKIADLKIWFGTQMGILKMEDNQRFADQKAQRAAELGILDAYAPIVGESVVELSMHFVRRSERKENGELFEEFYLYVLAQGMQILMKKPLEQVIGVTEDHYWRTHLPYNTWGDDIDMQDFWTDAKADIIGPVNELLDVWFSQLVENRTLRSMGMMFYNSAIEGFAPQTWQPQPFGAYGVPLPENGDIRQNIQRVEIPDLSESIDEMKYVQSMGELGTGATATATGAQTERQVTFGEVKLAYTEAKNRMNKGMSKYYVKVWHQRAYKFYKLIEAAGDKLSEVTLYKQGLNTTKKYPKKFNPKSDFVGKNGFNVKIWSKEEKDSSDMKALETLNVAVAQIPGNPVLLEEYQRKLCELSKLTPEKTQQILEFERKKREATLLAPPINPTTTPTGNPTLPVPAQQPAVV